jgi:hypothetical protein
MNTLLVIVNHPTCEETVVLGVCSTFAVAEQLIRDCKIHLKSEPTPPDNHIEQDWDDYHQKCSHWKSSFPLPTTYSLACLSEDAFEIITVSFIDTYPIQEIRVII